MTRQLGAAIGTLLLAAVSHRFGNPPLTVFLGGTGTVLLVMALTGFNVAHTVVMTFGIAMAIYAPVSIWNSVNLLMHASAATGSVVRIEHTTAGRWGSTVPHVGFRDGQGRYVEFEVPENLFRPGFHETVAVLYDPADPARSARLAGFVPMFGMDVIDGLLGIGLAIVGFVAARRYRARLQTIGPK